MKERRRSRTFRRLAFVTLLLFGGQVAARRIMAGWPLSLAQAWAVALLCLVGLWILWRGLGLDAAARRRRRLLRHRLSDLDRLSGSAFEDWVATVLESSGFRVESTPRTGDYGVDLIAERDGTRIDIERAIALLPEGARKVVVLRDIYGYKYEEIATMQGVALGTVKAQIHRARKMLKELLS